MKYTFRNETTDFPLVLLDKVNKGGDKPTKESFVAQWSKKLWKGVDEATRKTVLADVWDKMVAEKKRLEAEAKAEADKNKPSVQVIEKEKGAK